MLSDGHVGGSRVLVDVVLVEDEELESSVAHDPIKTNENARVRLFKKDIKFI